ncbi:hypothetical protein KDH_21800 [Dictyobacter sp. S3.2.2.5]|uniref:3-keto-disaccharide hydrolase domain-containing protein n=2 Tax=Dictyobacter halimunensis TaxID=3026934 RepID=A0ABQ6FM56_9CHLR|nr:hypothetical protein KDH_21800 [Dictyobacter sp. S3.2.2.5]
MSPVNETAFTPVNRPDGPPVNGPVFMPAGSPPPATGTTGYNSPVPYAHPSAYGQQQPPVGYPPVGYPPYMAPAAPKKRINPLFIALGIVLVVIVVLCGVLAYTLNSALAPVSRTPSGDTVAATPTALPTPTGKPVLDDNFGDNTNNWDLFQRSGYSAAIQQHTLVMTEGNGKMFLEHVPGARAMTDFQIDMTYILQNGDQAYVGVLFRRQSAAGSQKLRGYVLMIAPGSGRYSIRKIVDPSASNPSNTGNAAINLASGILDDSVPLNRSIQTTLTIQGTKMTFYVNGKQITTCDDNSSTSPYDTGSVDLLLQGSGSGTPARLELSHVALYDNGSGGPSI